MLSLRLVVEACVAFIQLVLREYSLIEIKYYIDRD